MHRLVEQVVELHRGLIVSCWHGRVSRHQLVSGRIAQLQANGVDTAARRFSAHSVAPLRLAPNTGPAGVGDE